jgi:lipopolysaccharide/colanic/teichoic acid biosynthesis glycosyltransferase
VGVTEAISSADTRLVIRVSSDVASSRRATIWHGAKRAVDVALASVLLLISAPLLVVAAVLVRLDSPGPVFFRQLRIGRNGARFRVIKLRTMGHGVSPEAHRAYIARLAAGAVEDGELKKLVDDPRVTRVGRILRRTSIDELPQLFNVLAGDMSIVGPRPALDYELEHYRDDHFDRFLVRPGITGLWQVSGRNELGFSEMLELDAEYARTAGPLRDAEIILRTPLAVLRARNA